MQAKINHISIIIVSCKNLCCYLKFTVFGWLEDSFTGMEQESAHMIGVGYLKGWKEAGVDIVLGIVGQLDNASKVLHGYVYTSSISEPGDTNIKDEVLAIMHGY